MDLLTFFLGFLCILVLAAVIFLLVHLHRKNVQLKTFLENNSGQQAGGSKPASSEVTAIDQLLYDRCCRYMTERRPFLVKDFSLQDLANAAYTNKGYLSKTINRFSGKNFRQYVNYYRVMYAMELFRNNMSLRITDLSELSGFNSVTSFFQSFKSVMGEPPSHWCSRVRRKYLKSMKSD